MRAVVKGIVTIPAAGKIINAKQFVITRVGAWIRVAKTLIDSLTIRIDIHVRVQGGGLRKAGMTQVDTRINDADNRVSAFRAHSRWHGSTIPDMVNTDKLSTVVCVEVINAVRVNLKDFRLRAQLRGFFEAHAGGKTIQNIIVTEEHLEVATQYCLRFRDKGIHVMVQMRQIR